MLHQASLIHIGLAKTATTSLQRNLLDPHPDIYHFGFDKRNLAMRWALMMIKSQDSIDYRQSAVTHVISGLFERNPLGKKKLVVSDEFLTLPYHPAYPAVDRAVIAQRLRDIFGDAKVLLVIRRPADLMCSLYSEWMKWYGTHHMSRDGIDSWVSGMLNRTATTWLSMLKYCDIFEIYCRIFGSDRMMLFLYEDLEKDNDAYAENLCWHIGVGEDGAGELFKKKRFRSRLTEWQVQERILFARRPWLWRAYERLSNFKLSRTLLRRISSSEESGFDLSPEVKERINQRYASQYEKLASETGLNLRAYGYYW